ncbi:MAG: hypothetical protein K8F59_17050 [Rhodobacteraceae bacterium]|nr:hypothetical protein [Paracoccaceae bacterium]
MEKSVESDQDHECVIGAVPTCPDCGSDNVVKDAWAYWDPDVGAWCLRTVFDMCCCDECGKEMTPLWRKAE